jgi:hypothetical protein
MTTTPDKPGEQLLHLVFVVHLHRLVDPASGRAD